MSEFIQQVQRDRSEAARRVAQCDALLANLRDLYPHLVDGASGSTHAAPSGVARDAAAPRQSREVRSPLVHLVRSVLVDAADWMTVREVTGRIRAQGAVVGDDDKLEQNVRAALTRRLPDVERTQQDGRTHLFRIRNAESPTAGDAAGLSEVPDQPPEGGEHTDGQGSHHDHRVDLGGRNGDRDHLGAPVGG